MNELSSSLWSLHSEGYPGEPGLADQRSVFIRGENCYLASWMAGQLYTVLRYSVAGLSKPGAFKEATRLLISSICRCILAGSTAMNHGCQTVPSISRDYEGSPNDHAKTVAQLSMLIDTADLSALIAPRPLLVVCGTADPFLTGSPDCAHKAVGEEAFVLSGVWSARKSFSPTDTEHAA